MENFKWVGENWGYFAMVFFIIVFTLATVLLRLSKNPKNVEGFIAWIRLKTYKITKEKLRKHPIFAKKAIYNQRTKGIVFSNQHHKTELFQLFILTKIEVNLDLLRFFLNNDFSKKKSPFRLAEMMEETVNDMKDEFDMKVKIKLRNFIESEVKKKDYTIEELNKFTTKLYRHIMHSEGGYVEKRDERLERIMTHISDIPINPIYNDNYERIYYFFDIISAVIDGVIVSAMKMYESFNGAIEKYFKDFIDGVDR